MTEVIPSLDTELDSDDDDFAEDLENFKQLFTKEVKSNFLMSEIAYTQLEAIKGIDTFIDERKDDEEWLNGFVPTSSSK